jgi:hypothetical protein
MRWMKKTKRNQGLVYSNGEKNDTAMPLTLEHNCLRAEDVGLRFAGY